jgi:hypothetical protein
MCRILAVPLTIILLAHVTTAEARGLYDDERTPVGWAWKQIRNDQIADFGARCGQLDPRTTNYWDDPCRQIPAKFLVDVLTLSELRRQIPQHGARLRGPRINGTIDLDNAEIMSAVWIDVSRIEGDLNLNHSHWAQPLSLRGSSLTGSLFANTMRTESLVALGDHAVIEGNVDLRGAKIGGNMELDTTTFGEGVNADGLSVRGNLLMRNCRAFGAEILLNFAKIEGSLDMTSSSFTKAVSAGGLNVSGALLMSGKATFAGDVNLPGAKISGDVDMETSSFAGRLNGNHLSIVGGLLMRGHAAFLGEVDLIGAKIDGPIEMTSSSFEDLVNLNAAKVGGSLQMNNSSFAKAVTADGLSVGGLLLMSGKATFGGDVILRGAKISNNAEMIGSSFAGNVVAENFTGDGNLNMRDIRLANALDLVNAKISGAIDLRGAIAAHVDLSGGNATELLMGRMGWWCPGGKPFADQARGTNSKNEPGSYWPLGDPAWRNARCNSTGSAILPMLVLRNTHIQAFPDSPDAWPPSMDLEGFRYEQLGSVGSGERDDVRLRSPKEWNDWLVRDRTFSSQPYTQLAATLFKGGRRDTAEAILFAGRERERGEAWVHGDLGSWAWLTGLSFAAGYGIGGYTFRVVWCVVGFTLLGFVFLHFSPSARAHSVLWRLGASLHRLLPIVKLSKEFDDFFDNPSNSNWPRNLNRVQVTYFAVHAIIGWVLGLILLAAMAGLTQKG